nr:PREDICTED: proline-serine-threonine phosphatase-interacting protein 2 isoform X3 [Latimeria chalumnae]|eukprot:XP_014350645.1 PREDICTED: proline-serine-threonine phosphatase-interacting protein 2 isoform X3 [Latimeria chalumnae]
MLVANLASPFQPAGRDQQTPRHESQTGRLPSGVALEPGTFPFSCRAGPCAAVFVSHSSLVYLFVCLFFLLLLSCPACCSVRWARCLIWGIRCPVEVENVAQCHIQLAQNLREEAKKLEDFREKQKEQRKKIEHLMESHHKQKTSLYKKTTDSKKTYEQKCRDKDEAEQLLNRNANVVNQKQYDKLLSKSSQTKATAEDADRTYQQNVTMLEKIMEEWQKEHINACEFFESQECDRIHLIRTAVWTHTNQLSQQCVTSDEMYEEIRKTLELCSVQKDIDYFVDLRKTSECPPAPLPYENFYNSQRNTAGRALNPGGGRC